ncbi:MAG: hypothetical protein BJ554DRAFT_2072 [Olpidium bornovanus]|uniref:Uncharacterized protein n=1 Tax=Olpidium bornovanus TaxID=278681 RepID=A0A8H8DH72_9FUNG|nr:MAG: hypothetical protein BJ554DRAFT_2072 [Olpidium bornovanus]
MYPRVTTGLAAESTTTQMLVLLVVRVRRHIHRPGCASKALIADHTGSAPEFRNETNQPSKLLLRVGGTIRYVRWYIFVSVRRHIYTISRHNTVPKAGRGGLYSGNV